MPISSIKGNVKNTYIKKISSLMSVHHSKEDLRNEGGEKRYFFDIYEYIIVMKK